MMLEIEKNILQQEYDRCLDEVKDSSFHRLYADEKMLHSLQVFDAGNYIISNENVFKNWSVDLLRMARAAVLFHDIGRFQEIINLYHSVKGYGHAILGYDFLLQYQKYNDLRILLPIKYHSCLIEELYKDVEYNNIENPQRKYEVEKITFLVRDADKIANFKLLATANEDILRLFHMSEEDRKVKTPISPEVLTYMFEKKSVDHSVVKTTSDKILSLICWIFDLNYRSSFAFIKKNDCFNFLLEELRRNNPDEKLQEEIEAFLMNYLTEKYQQL